MHPEGIGKGRRDSITWSAERENTGVVRDSALAEDLEGPEGVARDGEVGRSIAQDALARGLLDEVEGKAEISPETLRPEAMNRAVRVAMRGDLMAVREDSADEPGIRLGDQAE